MGVTGLWQLIQEVGRPVRLETLEGKVLAVDVSIWLHQAVKGMRDKGGNPVHNAHLISLFNKVCKLLFYRVKPVFVFDGGVPALKKKTMAGRRERRENIEKESQKTAKKLLSTYLKSYALQQVNGDAPPEPLNLPSSSKNEADMFELPPIPTRSNSLEYIDSSSEDDAPYSYFQDVQNVDIDSEDFKTLPSELQHEILTEIKDVRKTRFQNTRQELPEDTNDFSSFQIKKLLRQSKLSSRIEDVRKDMNREQTGEIIGDVDPDFYEMCEVDSRRIVSDHTSHYILVKGLAKKKKQLETIKQQENARLEDLKKYFEEIKKDEPKEENQLTEDLQREGTLHEEINEINFNDYEQHASQKSVLKTTDRRKLKSVMKQERTKLSFRNRKNEDSSENKIKNNIDLELYPPPSNAVDITVDKLENDDAGRMDNGDSSSSIAGKLRSHQPACLRTERFTKNVESNESIPELEEIGLLGCVKVENANSNKICNVNSALNSNEGENLAIISDGLKSDASNIDEQANVNLTSKSDLSNIDEQTNVNLTSKSDLSNIGEQTNVNLTSKSDLSNIDEQANVNLTPKRDMSNIGEQTNVNLTSKSDLSNIGEQTNVNLTSKSDLSNIDEQANVNLTPKRDMSNIGEQTNVKLTSESGASNITLSTNTDSSTKEYNHWLDAKQSTLQETGDSIPANVSAVTDDSVIGDHRLGNSEQKLEMQDSNAISIVGNNLASSGDDNVKSQNSMDGKEVFPRKAAVIDNETGNVSTLNDVSTVKRKDEVTCIPAVTIPPVIDSGDSDADDDFISLSEEEFTDHPLTGSTDILQARSTSIPAMERVDISDWPEANTMDSDIEDFDFLHQDKQVSDEEDESISQEFSAQLQTLSEGGLAEFRNQLDEEVVALQSQQGKQQRLAVSMTDQIYTQAQELLELFGLPYVLSPMEAEAECAYLERAGLTQGTITEDSDIWLFGGQKVYKNFFNKSKLVQFYKVEDLVSQYELSRDNLINLALLCGSDYTVGIQGVGPVTAMDILREFPGEKQDGLCQLKKWWKKSHKQPVSMSDSKLRTKLRQITLLQGFPDKCVVDAYLNPEVDPSTEKFTWAMPDLDSIRHYTQQNLGWPKTKTDEILVPVIKELNKPSTQGRITSFFTPEVSNVRSNVKRTNKRAATSSSAKSKTKVVAKPAYVKKKIPSVKERVCLSESSSDDSEESTNLEENNSVNRPQRTQKVSFAKGKKRTAHTKKNVSQAAKKVSTDDSRSVTKGKRNVAETSVNSTKPKYSKRSLSSHMPL